MLRRLGYRHPSLFAQRYRSLSARLGRATPPSPELQGLAPPRRPLPEALVLAPSINPVWPVTVPYSLVKLAMLGFHPRPNSRDQTKRADQRVFPSIGGPFLGCLYKCSRFPAQSGSMLGDSHSWNPQNCGDCKPRFGLERINEGFGSVLHILIRARVTILAWRV